MSNYYPRSMNQWKMQKRCASGQQNQTQAGLSLSKHRSLIIHSFDSQGSKEPPANVISLSTRYIPASKNKMQSRSWAGLKGNPHDKNRSKQTSNNRKHLLIESSYNSEKLLDEIRSKQMKWMRSPLYKEHKLRKELTLKEMAQKGMTNLLVIRSPKDVTSKAEPIEQRTVSCPKENENIAFHPYQQRVNSARACRNKVNRQPSYSASKMQAQGQNNHKEYQCSIAPAAYCEEDSHNFLCIKQSLIYTRPSKPSKQKTKSPKTPAAQFQILEKHRKKLVNRAHLLKCYQLPISPWEISQNQI